MLLTPEEVSKLWCPEVRVQWWTSANDGNPAVNRPDDQSPAKNASEPLQRSSDGDWIKELSGRYRFTPEIGGRILKVIADGGTFKLAAASVGIGSRTLSDWREVSPEFARAVQTALAHAAMRHIANINQAADRGDWRASERLLRVNPLTKEEFGQQGVGRESGPVIQVNIGIDRGNGPSKVDVAPSKATQEHAAAPAGTDISAPTTGRPLRTSCGHDDSDGPRE